MKITVIIPIYNSERYLEECLLSVKHQTFTDFECLLIDDGSTDDSGLIAKTFTENDKRGADRQKKRRGCISKTFFL